MLRHLVNPSNVLKAGYSFLRSTLTGNAEVMGMPLALSAELTNNCNLNCPECSAGSGRMKRGRGFMEIELFDRVISELRPYLININLYFQGEPMLHPKFFSFIGNSSDTYTVVSTNGHFLNESDAEKLVRSGLGKLIISLDGADQRTYAEYRKNGSLDKVMDGIRYITEAKRKFNSSLNIEIQVLVNRFNENQIPIIKEMAWKVKAKLRLKSMQILDEEDIGSWLPENSKFRRYKKKGENYVTRNSISGSCARLWFNPVITWDGKVIPCCFDKDNEYVMGDLKQDSFTEIWNGPKYRIFRKSILTDRHMIDICRNCTSGMMGVRY
jgi:radical SAM protein with 4Fe4S-binding SPASM domain